MKRIICFCAIIMAVVSCDLLSDKEITKEYLELPDFVVVDFIDGWSEVRFAQNGLISFHKTNLENRTTEIMMYIPDTTYGIIPLFARFDEAELPRFIAWGDTELHIEYNEDKTVNIIMVADDAVWSVENQACPDLRPYMIETKAWNDNTAIQNICAIGNVIVGASAILGGVSLITASGILEVSSYTAATPISIAGISLGCINIAGGSAAIRDGLETIFGPAKISDENDYYVQSLLGMNQEILCSWIEESPNSKRIQKFVPASLLKNVKDLGKMGTVQYWCSFGFATLDKLFGKTPDRKAKLAKVHNRISVVTNSASNITANSATLSGFVSPEATKPLGTKVSTELAIVLEERDNKDSKIYKSIIDGDGGNIMFTFNNLKPDTEYRFFTIFHDKENGFCRSGNVLSFKTSSSLPALQSIVYDNLSYAYISDCDCVQYILSAKYTNGLLPEDVSSLGIYYKDKSTGEKYEVVSMDTSSSEVTFAFSVPREKFNMINTFDYRCLVDFGIFYKTSDTIMLGDTKEVEFVYNQIPSIAFVEVQIVYQDNTHYNFDGIDEWWCTHEDHVSFMILNAAFYRPKLYYYHSNYSEPVYQTSITADGKYNDNRDLQGHVYHKGDEGYEHYFLKFPDDTEIYSNKLKYYYDGELHRYIE